MGILNMLRLQVGNHLIAYAFHIIDVKDSYEPRPVYARCALNSKRAFRYMYRSIAVQTFVGYQMLLLINTGHQHNNSLRAI